MSAAETEHQRPVKKRRFFVEQSPVAERSLARENCFHDQSNDILETSLSISGADDSTYAASTSHDDDKVPEISVESHGDINENTGHENGTFDAKLFESVVGAVLDSESTRCIREMAGDSMERGSYC